MQRQPKEIITEIALNLPLRDLLNYCLTNKNFSNICKSNSFWIRRLVKDFQLDKYINLQDIKNPKELYIEILQNKELCQELLLYEKNPDRYFLKFLLDRNFLPSINAYLLNGLFKDYLNKTIKEDEEKILYKLISGLKYRIGKDTNYPEFHHFFILVLEKILNRHVPLEISLEDLCKIPIF